MGGSQPSTAVATMSVMNSPLPTSSDRLSQRSDARPSASPLLRRHCTRARAMASSISVITSRRMPSSGPGTQRRTSAHHHSPNSANGAASQAGRAAARRGRGCTRKMATSAAPKSAAPKWFRWLSARNVSPGSASSRPL